jgi:hypothetical protein
LSQQKVKESGKRVMAREREEGWSDERKDRGSDGERLTCKDPL